MAEFYTYLFDTRYPSGGSRVAYKVDSGLTDLESGELVCWSATGLKRFVRDNTAGKLVGISADSQKGVAKLGNQSALTPDRISVFTTGVHKLTGTVGDTYVHGDVVYMAGTTTKIVTKTAGGGNQIGIVWSPEGKSYVGAILVPIKIDDFTIAQV